MKTPVSESLFDKKETPTQVFFCEFCEFFTNIFFYRAPPVAASGLNFPFFQLQIRILADPCSSITLIPLGLEVQNQIVK